MAQLVVRKLPDEVKERLKRRAKRSGRSLEAEVREVLSQVPEPPPVTPENGADWVSALAKKMQDIGVTDVDIEALNEGIAELGRDWRMREIDLGSTPPPARRKRGGK